ncbi:hypothetical protein [Streptomyces cinereoruber]|uniref:hypothetical protein n=1 Tax=Streptomyces cinereoruber TaxID=67260 RepID=UPI003637EF2B
MTEGGAAEPLDAPGLAVAPEAEAEGEAEADGDAEGDPDVRRGAGDDDVGPGLPEEGDGSSETAGFRDALVVTSGTAARSSGRSAPPRAVAARAAVPATATAAAAAIAAPRLRPRGRPPPGGGGTSPTPRSSSGIVSEGSPPVPYGYSSG